MVQTSLLHPGDGRAVWGHLGSDYVVCVTLIRVGKVSRTWFLVENGLKSQ